METDKNSRLLYLYEMLVHGEGLQKKEAAARFGVNERSIQRDIDCLRNFFCQSGAAAGDPIQGEGAAV